MHLCTMGATVVSDKLYFTSSDFNALFCVDLKDKKILYKTYFTEYGKYRKELYAKQILYNGKIYFVPRACDKVAIFDIGTEEISYIEIEGKGEGPIRDAFIEGNFLWMLYSQYPAHVFKINLTTKKCGLITPNWIRESHMITEPGKYIKFESAKQVDKCWWIFAERQGYLLNYDWRRNEIREYSIECFQGKMMTGNVREKAWMMVRGEDRVLEYDYKNNTKNWLQIREIGQIPGDVMRIIVQDEYILFIKKKGMTVMSKENYAVKNFMFSREKNLICYAVYEGKMILFPAQGKDLIVFYFGDNKIEEYAFVWEKEMTEKNLETYFSGCISEKVCDIAEFVNVASTNRKYDYQDNGKAIWNSIGGNRRQDP